LLSNDPTNLASKTVLQRWSDYADFEESIDWSVEIYLRGTGNFYARSIIFISIKFLSRYLGTCNLSPLSLIPANVVLEDSGNKSNEIVLPRDGGLQMLRGQHSELCRVSAVPPLKKGRTPFSLQNRRRSALRERHFPL